jgi:hypothetical protein
MTYRILPSARKHGIADEDILHAIEFVVTWRQRNDRNLYLGSDRAGNMLEVITIIEADESEIVIHAMRMRRRYEPTLRGTGGPDD